MCVSVRQRVSKPIAEHSMGVGLGLGLGLYIVRLAQLWNHVAVYHYHLTYGHYFC